MAVSAHTYTAKVHLATPIWGEGVFYSTEFDTMTGWTVPAEIDSEAALSPAYVRTPTNALKLSGATNVGIHRVLSGLQPGKEYAVDFWVYSAKPDTYTYVASDWGSDEGHWFSSAGWFHITYTFTPVNAYAFIHLEGGAEAGDTELYIDSVRVRGEVPLYEYDLSPKDGSVKLDEGWAPHVQGSLTIAARDESILQLLDPREDVRVEITATSSDGSRRTFDLGLRERTIDHNTGETRLELASDEARLQDDLLIDDSPNTSARDYQSSLRDIINNVVLSRIDAELEPGTADSPYRVLSDAENMFTNPRAEIDLTNASSSGLTSMVRQPGMGFRLNGWAGANDSWVTMDGDAGALRVGMTAGRMYTASGTFRIDSPLPGTEINRSRRIVVFTKVGAAAYVMPMSPQAPNVPGSYRVAVTFVVPAGATEAFVRFYHGHAGAGSAYWTDLRLSEGVESEFFDGSTPDTSEYAYQWTGAVGLSKSTRTALIDRSPDTLKWEPGESSWDFVQPLFQAVGFRLFCDEQRKWHLVDDSYHVDGLVQVAEGFNITDAQDTIARDSAGDWFDAVLVKYTWKDSETAESMTAYDIATTPNYTKPAIIEIERPFPGPGFAAYALSRAQGRGRVLDLGAISDYSVQPGMEVVATLPNSPIQTGVVAAVEWNFSSDEMQVESRGLIDTPRTAWRFLLPGVKWSDSATGQTWANETI